MPSRRTHKYYENLPLFEQITTVPEFDKNGLTKDARGMLAYACQIFDASNALADELANMNCHSLLDELHEALDALGVDVDNDV